MPYRWITHDIIEEYDAVQQINVTELEEQAKILKKIAEINSPNEEPYGTDMDQS